MSDWVEYGLSDRVPVRADLATQSEVTHPIRGPGGRPTDFRRRRRSRVDQADLNRVATDSRKAATSTAPG